MGGVAVSERTELRVTCETCHHGVTRPEPIQPILAATLQEHGVDSVIGHYNALRDEYYGSHSYDFRQHILINIAEDLIGTNNEGAMQLLEYNLGLFPESSQTLWTIGTVHRENGDMEAAVDYLERALAIEPTNSFFQSLLERWRSEQ